MPSYITENHAMSNQPSPFASVPTPASNPSGKTSVLAIVLIVVAVGFVAVLACGSVLSYLLLPTLGKARAAAQHMSRSNDLRQIGVAIHNYNSVYKQLPPTVSVDQNGKEISCWRISLVPYLDLGIPASDPADMPAVAPLVYSGEPGSSETRVFAIVADNSAFPPTPNTVIRLRSVSDGLANTLIAVSLPNRVADWKSNVNLTPDKAYQRLMSLKPDESALLLMADGSVLSFRESDDWLDDRATFDALVSRNGGDSVTVPPH